MKHAIYPQLKKFCKFINNYEGELRIMLDGSIYDGEKLFIRKDEME